MYHNLCFEQKYEKYHNFPSENYHFTAVKNRSILHRRVFVMNTYVDLAISTGIDAAVVTSPLIIPAQKWRNIPFTYLVLAMSTGIEAAVVTSPLIILAQKWRNIPS